MKILLSGAWEYSHYEQACFDAFCLLGHQVVPHPWPPTGTRETLARRLYARLMRGRIERDVNTALLLLCKQESPDLLVAYRPTLIRRSTLEELRVRLPSMKIAAICNDDPFSPDAAPALWQEYISALSSYDVHFVYRQRNIADFLNAGARCCRLLLPYYVPDTHHPGPLEAAQQARFGSDVVFVGHYESDGRADLLSAILHAGHRLRIFGSGWGTATLPGTSLRTLRPIRPVFGEDYRAAIASSKIALAFYSRLNRDAYTRRCFEIPAIGTPMLAQWSKEMEGLFVPDEEVSYFHDQSTLLLKVRTLLRDDVRRSRMAQAALSRVRSGGHDSVSRMSELLAMIG